MSTQQDECVMKTQFTPEPLDDNALSDLDWTRGFDEVFANPSGVAVVGGNDECLVHDLEDYRWYHYQLPDYTISLILGRNSDRLWCVVTDGSIAILDLRSGSG